MDDVLVLCRFVHYSAALALFGSTLFRTLLGRLEPQTLTALDRRLLLGQRLVAGLAIVSALAWLLLVAASMGGASVSELTPSILLAVLGKTFFGKVWCWHLVSCFGLLLVLVRSWRGEHLLRPVLAGLLLASLAPVGHGAMLDGWAGRGLVLNQVIHLLCAGAWFGGLLLLAGLLYQSPEGTHMAALRRFSGVGYGLVAGVTLSGLLNVWGLVGTWPTPYASTFGLVLTIKLALVGVMLALALVNRLALAFRQRYLLALRRSVMLEWCFGLAAVAAVSLLGTLSPVPG
ncbi:copper homeostasis membrane protein CopD [Pseudomonas sp. CR3202]|uniref:copper homeostasis membrane protein CopD n=1 Tax=Pseudomonas sp. CR3202 TaxID=3351532 RepID=UPI003BF110B7